MSETPSDPTAERVARTLDQIRAGVRQRQAAIATRPGRTGELPASVARVQLLQTLQEPLCTSHRPLVGPVVVFAKRAFFHLFMKWYLRSVVQQQNDFNRAAAVALQDLVERQRELARNVEELAGRLAAGAAEDRRPSAPARGPGPPET